MSGPSTVLVLDTQSPSPAHKYLDAPDRLVVVTDSPGLARHALSTMVVQSSTSASPFAKRCILDARRGDGIWPCATSMRASGTSAWRREAILSMVSTRLWRKNVWPPRASSRRIAERMVSSESRVTCVSVATRSRGGVRRSEKSRVPVMER